jgi:membrane protease YdiL (CAAX protease family)
VDEVTTSEFLLSGTNIAFLIVGALQLSAFVIFTSLAVTRLRGQVPLIKFDGMASPIGLVDIFVAFALWFAAQALSVGALFLFAEGDIETVQMDTLQMMFLGSAGQLIATLLAGMYLIFRYKSATSFGLRIDRTGRDVGVGVVAFFIILPIVLAVQWVLTLLVPYEHPTLDMLKADSPWSTFAICWFGAVIVAPITEEFFFRGLVHNWLQRLSRKTMSDDQLLVGGWDEDPINVASEVDSEPESVLKEPVSIGEIVNPYEPGKAVGSSATLESNSRRPVVVPAHWPIIVSAIVFGGVHLGQGLAPIPLFIFAIGLGYLYRQTSSLVSCITLHFLLNFYSMFWYTVSVFTGEAP